MTDHVRIFKSPRYDEEVEGLIDDPIIQALADELPDGLGNAELESWGFVSSASTTYHQRGGRGGFSIGGPAEAIKRLYARRQA